MEPPPFNSDFRIFVHSFVAFVVTLKFNCSCSDFNFNLSDFKL